MPGKTREGTGTEPLSVTIKGLQALADTGVGDLPATQLPDKEHTPLGENPTAPVATGPQGTQEVITLADDLLLARTDMQNIPDEAHSQHWELDFSGWLFLHFRLDGLSREVGPDGSTATVGAQSFLLTASHTGATGMRQVLGENWRTVGIACRPSFLSRELGISEGSLPEDLHRFEAGDPDAEAWYVGGLNNEMLMVAKSLLQPTVTGSMKSIYLRAKAVELVCLAIDSLSDITPLDSSALRLSKHDVSCLNHAQQILEEVVQMPTLQDLARQVGLNRNKLATGFKRVFGETVGGYHRALRLQRAYKRLEEGELSIGRIAEEAGYQDAGSFSKAFKLRFGLLPSDMKSVPP